MTLATAITGLRNADAAGLVLRPQFVAALAVAEASGDQADIARHQQRLVILDATREAVGKCLDRSLQVAP